MFARRFIKWYKNQFGLYDVVEGSVEYYIGYVAALAVFALGGVVGFYCLVVMLRVLLRVVL